LALNRRDCSDRELGPAAPACWLAWLRERGVGRARARLHFCWTDWAWRRDEERPGPEGASSRHDGASGTLIHRHRLRPCTAVNI